MRNAVAIRSLLFSFVLLTLALISFGQVSISVSFGPPPIPVYEQPICPAEGYIWTPGYWAYDDDDGYYWVPGTWVEAPEPGYLWTPGYWGWGDGAYIFHEGYWGPHVGFYGGINYGYGYTGRGYEGGRWDHDRFFYNRSVNHVNETIIHNTYNTTIVENNNTRISYNGGRGGVEARPTSQEESFSGERHIARVPAQNEHIQQARSNPELRATRNQGKPPIAATAKPADFRSGAVPARQDGGAYQPPPANAARPTTRRRLQLRTVTPVNCSPTRTRRRTPATPRPTSDIRTSRTSSLRNKVRNTRNYSSSRKKNISRLRGKALTTHTDSRWSSVTLSKPNSSSKSMLPSSSTSSSINNRGRTQGRQRTILRRNTRIDPGTIKYETGWHRVTIGPARFLFHFLTQRTDA